MSRAGPRPRDFEYDFLNSLTSASNYFIFGNSGGPPARVNGPARAAVDTSRNIHVVDAGNYRVAKYNSRGGLTSLPSVRRALATVSSPQRPAGRIIRSGT